MAKSSKELDKQAERQASVAEERAALENEVEELSQADQTPHDNGLKQALEAKAILAAIVESSDDAIISTDLNGTINTWNRAAERLYGYTAREAVGQPITMLIPPDRLDEEPGILEKIRRGPRIEHYETVRRRKDGTLLDISLSVSPLRDTQGRVIGASKIGRNITERKRVQEALRASEERYRLLFDLGSVAVYSCDTSGVIKEFNRRAAELWGRSPAPGDTDERFCGSFKLFRPDGSFMPHEQCPMAEVVSGKVSEVRDGEVHIERPDGSRITVIVNIRPLKNERGNVVGAINCFYDISDRKRTEAARRESERRFREMIDALPTAIYTTDAEGRLTHFNPAAVELSGRVPQLGTDQWCVSWKLFWPDGTPMPHDECPMAIALKEGRIVRGAEAILERPDGKRIWFTPYPTPLRDASGRIVGGINMLVDITERKQAEKASALLAAIVHSSDDAIISKDLTGVITSWNEGAERLFGYSAEEAVGQSVTMLIPSDRPHEETMILDRLKRGERIEHFETIRVRKDGASLNISLTISPVKDGTGRIIGASKVARDISEQKQAEAALRRSEKLAATGQLASTIAHEINNPMQALTNLLALLTYKTDIDTEARTIAEMALSELGRMAHITKQMLSFHRDTLTPVPLRITEVLEDALELWAIKLKGQLRVERKYESTEHIPGFPGELRQVFVNLIGNALEAAPAGAALRLHVFPSHDWKQMRPGVRVVVADRGSGIKREHLGKIFEPFFTTKNEKGTGLGLWVSKQTLERHGGNIRVRTSTRAGRSGTVFSVFLPRQEAKILTLVRDSAAVA